jgi:hypothetical protein
MTNFPRAAISALALCLTLVAPVLAETAPSVIFTDGKAAPTTVEVPAGMVFTLTVRNAGKRPAEFESKRLHVEKLIPPGHKLILKMALPAGRYPFIDDFHSAAKGVIVAK